MRQAAMFPKGGLPRALEAAFARLWAAYPPRTPNPRALAEKEFARAVKAGAAADDLVGAAAGYAAEVQRLGTANDFVVHASTFLRQARFRDYLGAALAAPINASAEPDHTLWPAMRAHMDAATFMAWFGRCEVADMNGQLVLLTQHRIVASRIREDFLPLLRQAFPDRPITVHFQEHSR